MAGISPRTDRAGHLDNMQPGAAIYPIKTSTATEPTIAEPNPPFVFPARSSIDSSNNLDKRSPTMKSGLSSIQTDLGTLAKRRTASALPSFNFSPASAIEPPSAENSPNPSIASSPIAIRTGGHRRGGSEFIGGDGKKGGPGLMSTSPTKGSDSLPFPVQHATSSSIVGRRGHAHRRSGAISCHDLSVILKPQVPSASLRGGSAPTTPAGNEERPAFPTNWSMQSAQEQLISPSSKDTQPETPAVQEPVQKEADTRDVVPRARVGFSDTLEFIPRPLSALSSDTSSSLATVRGHSASASISSINSILSSSPAAARVSRKPRSTDMDDESEAARPQTAGAVMGSQGLALTTITETSRPTLRRPTSASALPSSPTNPEGSCFTKFISKKASLPDYQTSPIADFSSLQFNPSSFASSPPPSPAEEHPPARSRDISASADVPEAKKMPSKASKKPKNVKNWAGSILSRKSKGRKTSSKATVRRSPTPPLPREARAQEHTFLSFDSVSTCPSVDRLHSSKPVQPKLDAAIPPASESEALSPVIDLDAALGPFNTPSLNGEGSNARRSGFAKRKMHSSGAVGGFAGPGMHYHRRTESAPEMVAFDFGHFGLHRLGSSSTMADVFEEDEEEEAEALQASKAAVSSEDSENLGIGIQVVDSDTKDGAGMDWTLPEASSARRSLRKDMEIPQLPTKDTPIEAPLKQPAVSDDMLAPSETPKGLMEIFGKEREGQLRPSSFAKPSDSTIAPITNEEIKGRAAITELGAPSPRSPYLNPQTPSSSYSSPFPSPDFPPASFEAPRVVTASSSFTDDRTINSLLLGEPGPEVRMSVDDVPSLTSSTSTMTSAVNNYAGHFRHGSVYANHGNRSSSSVGIARPRPATHHGKRASLVSLSRLVGSSHGEKSKLSIESRAQPDSPEKPSRERRGKRLSRIMQFFKPKEYAR